MGAFISEMWQIKDTRLKYCILLYICIYLLLIIIIQDFYFKGKDQVKILDPSIYFRPEDIEKETGWTFRIFKEQEDPKMKQVYEIYSMMHQNQCVEYVINRVSSSSFRVSD